MREYATAFYRDEQSAKKLRKPPGWVTSTHRTTRREEVQRTVNAINSQNPEHPAHVVEL